MVDIQTINFKILKIHLSSLDESKVNHQLDVNSLQNTQLPRTVHYKQGRQTSFWVFMDSPNAWYQLGCIKTRFPIVTVRMGLSFWPLENRTLFFGVQKVLKESSEVKTNCFTNLHRLVFFAKMSNDFPHKDWINMFFLCEHWLFFFLFVSGHSECPHEMFCWIFSRFFCAGWPEGEHSRIRWEPQNWLQYITRCIRIQWVNTQFALCQIYFELAVTNIYIYLQISIRYLISRCISRICDLYLFHIISIICPYVICAQSLDILSLPSQ